MGMQLLRVTMPKMVSIMAKRLPNIRAILMLAAFLLMGDPSDVAEEDEVSDPEDVGEHEEGEEPGGDDPGCDGPDDPPPPSDPGACHLRGEVEVVVNIGCGYLAYYSRTNRFMACSSQRGHVSCNRIRKAEGRGGGGGRPLGL